ncbi:MAG: hypothetical protein RIQ89_2290 [Bacteroidota bacterium]|jgi:uncharacterized protein YdeI (YjbR/CyaY-like superfamily)
MKEKLDKIFNNAKLWKPEMELLRKILLSCGLEEELKWYQPCYSHNGKNLFIIGSFKDYCTLSFFQGVLLKDEHQILEFPGPNTQSAKLIKFTNVDQILKTKAILKAYIFEMMAASEAGLAVKFKKIEERPVPQELSAAFQKDALFHEAFKKLTPGRQRQYLMHIESAKQSATRASRVETCKPLILAGKGLMDDYKKKGSK